MSEQTTQSLLLNFSPSQYLIAYINAYPNCTGIITEDETSALIGVNMTQAQIVQFQTDVANNIVQLVTNQ